MGAYSPIPACVRVAYMGRVLRGIPIFELGCHKRSYGGERPFCTACDMLGFGHDLDGCFLFYGG